MSCFARDIQIIIYIIYFHVVCLSFTFILFSLTYIAPFVKYNTISHIYLKSFT